MSWEEAYKAETLPYPTGYTPTSWVLSVVGKTYHSGGDGLTYVCTGYNPRWGFWMAWQGEAAESRITNVSERAIGRTFHEVRERAS
jgi:hypothetical protein